MEVAGLLVRGLFLVVLMIKGVVSYRNHDTTAFAFFLLSRLWIIFLWTIFAVEFHKRQENRGSDVGEEPRGIHLSKVFKYDIVSDAFRIAVFLLVVVCGVLDMTVLRLLPWLPTEFSKIFNGYPNLFAFRHCVYGSNVSLVLQFIASVVLVVNERQSSSDLALSVILILLSLSLLQKTVIESVVGFRKERSDMIVTVLEVDRQMLRSASAQAASDYSLIEKQNGMTDPRFSDSEEVWTPDNNPLQSSFFLDGSSIDEADVTELRVEDNKKSARKSN